MPNQNEMLSLFDDDELPMIVPADQQEDEGDLPRDKMGDPSQSVLFNTDWTVATLVQQIERGNVHLDPEFQRRSAWDPRRRSQLIESLVIGLPVPNVVLAEKKDARGQFIVIDGKQRLSTIFDFLSPKSTERFKLSGLDVRADLNGLGYEGLREKFPQDADFLENAPIRTVVIRNWPSEYFLYVIFDRLNSGSLPLSPQELRRALHPGPMLGHIDEYLQRSEVAKAALGLKGLDRRMRDSELVLRFVALEKFYPDYDGDFKAFLDRPASYFNGDWERRVEELDGILKRLDQAFSTSIHVFGSDAFKKWNGEKFERRMNRALFDCIVRYFGDSRLHDPAVEAADTIIHQLKVTTELSAEFRRSIEQTTKTPWALETRLSVWGMTLADCLGMRLDSQSFRLVP